MTPETDAALVERMRAGDAQAFGELYERYRNDVYRTACLIAGNRADGEDLTQDAFVTAYRAIGQLRDPSRFRPWLLRLLTRNAWRQCGKRKREQPVDTFFETGEAAESALSAVLRSEEDRMLYAALASLDEKQRTTVILYYFNELPVKEIARITGTFEGTVKSRLYKARHTLQQQLTQLDFHERKAT